MRKEVPKMCIDFIWDMYKGSRTSVNSMCGVTKDFDVGGVH